MDSNPLHGCPGGLYGPTPRGTMVIRLDTGPAASLSGRCLICRSLGPADWWAPPTGLVWSRQVASAAGGSLPAADYCNPASNDAGSVMRSWRQLCRLAGDRCGHYLSCLINGAWGPWEGPADFWWPTPIRADWWCFRRLSYARLLVGPIIPGSYQQAVVGTRLCPLGLMSGPSWQQCHAARRSPRVRRTVATPALGKGVGVDLTVATPRPVPLYEGMGVVGVAGRLPKAGFSGSRQSGVGLS